MNSVSVVGISEVYYQKIIIRLAFPQELQTAESNGVNMDSISSRIIYIKQLLQRQFIIKSKYIRDYFCFDYILAVQFTFFYSFLHQSGMKHGLAQTCFRQ